ncbi:unnamed protein product, partial [Mesorhabditis spiculigera]
MNGEMCRELLDLVCEFQSPHTSHIRVMQLDQLFSEYAKDTPPSEQIQAYSTLLQQKEHPSAKLFGALRLHKCIASHHTLLVENASEMLRSLYDFVAADLKTCHGKQSKAISESEMSIIAIIGMATCPDLWEESIDDILKAFEDDETMRIGMLYQFVSQYLDYAGPNRAEVKKRLLHYREDCALQLLNYLHMGILTESGCDLSKQCLECFEIFFNLTGHLLLELSQFVSRLENVVVKDENSMTILLGVAEILSTADDMVCCPNLVMKIMRVLENNVIKSARVILLASNSCPDDFVAFTHFMEWALNIATTPGIYAINEDISDMADNCLLFIHEEYSTLCESTSIASFDSQKKIKHYLAEIYARLAVSISEKTAYPSQDYEAKFSLESFEQFEKYREQRSLLLDACYWFMGESFVSFLNDQFMKHANEGNWNRAEASYYLLGILFPRIDDALSKSTIEAIFCGFSRIAQLPDGKTGLVFSNTLLALMYEMVDDICEYDEQYNSVRLALNLGVMTSRHGTVRSELTRFLARMVPRCTPNSLQQHAEALFGYCFDIYKNDNSTEHVRLQALQIIVNLLIRSERHTEPFVTLLNVIREATSADHDAERQFAFKLHSYCRVFETLGKQDRLIVPVISEYFEIIASLLHGPRSKMSDEALEGVIAAFRALTEKELTGHYESFYQIIDLTMKNHFDQVCRLIEFIFMKCGNEHANLVHRMLLWVRTWATLPKDENLAELFYKTIRKHARPILLAPESQPDGSELLVHFFDYFLQTLYPPHDSSRNVRLNKASHRGILSCFELIETNAVLYDKIRTNLPTLIELSLNPFDTRFFRDVTTQYFQLFLRYFKEPTINYVEQIPGDWMLKSVCRCTPDPKKINTAVVQWLLKGPHRHM